MSWFSWSGLGIFSSLKIRAQNTIAVDLVGYLGAHQKPKQIANTWVECTNNITPNIVWYDDYEKYHYYKEIEKIRKNGRQRMNNFFSTKQSWYDYGGKYDLLMLTSACKLESDQKKNMILISILRAWLLFP